MNIIPRTLRHAVRNPLTTGMGIKVLTELHEQGLNTVDFTPVKPWHVAELLRADRSSVQRALTHLVEVGYLERGEGDPGRGFAYRIATPHANGNPPTPVAA